MSGNRDRSNRAELIAASVVTGVLGAATIYLSEAHLGLEEFAPLAQLWTLWALCASSITFSVQHWLIRAVVDGSDHRVVSRTLAFVIVPMAGAAVVAGWLLADQWFAGHRGFGLLFGLLVLGTAFNGYGRGLVAAAGAPRQLAGLLIGENLIRLVLLVPLAVVGAAPFWYGIAMTAGFLVNLAALQARPRERATNTSAVQGAPTALLVAGAVGLISYATMFGGPLLLGPAGVAPSEISAMFLVITIARVPFIVVLGLLPSIALHLEVLVAGRRADDLRMYCVRAAAMAALSGAVVAGIAASGLGNVLGRILGTSDQFGGNVFAMVGAASAISLGALILSMVFVAQKRHRILGVIWLVPLGAAGFGLVLNWFSSVSSLSVWLVGVEVAMVILLTSAQLVGRSREVGSAP